MKKVLHISKYYYPFLGGTEQVARDIVDAMRGMDDVEQKVICFNEDVVSSDGAYKRGQTVYDSVDGVEVVRCGCQMKLASQSLSLSYGRELRRIMNEFKPDVVILHFPNPFVTHYLLKYKKRDFKLAVYWHLDITKQKLLKKVFQGQTLALIERADKILGATPKHLEESECTPYFKDKKYILPYMIDQKNLVITEEEKKEAANIRARYAGKKLGFFIGRHVPYKGLKYLIEASKELGDEPVHFCIAGEGALTAGLKALAKGDDKVEFLGRISDSERRSYLEACDIVCFPSITRNEGFGLALAEGMYYGKPAVTFTIPGSGVNYVNLDGVTGIECENCNSSEYAKALKLLCQDDELRVKYGEAARQRVLDNFTEDRFRANIREFLEKI